MYINIYISFAHGFTLQHRIRTRVLLVESPKLCHWATVLYMSSNISGWGWWLNPSHNAKYILIYLVMWPPITGEESPFMCCSRHQPSLLSRPESTASRPQRVNVSCNSSTSMRRCITRRRRHSGACKHRFWLLDPQRYCHSNCNKFCQNNYVKMRNYIISKTRTLIMIHEVWIYQIQAGMAHGNRLIHPGVCGHVVTGVRRLQSQVELSDVVTGSVVDREVITINYWSDIICFCLRSMSNTAESTL